MEKKTYMKKDKTEDRIAAKAKGHTPPVEEKFEKVGLHNLRIPKGAHKKKRILGRGPSSGHGKTSTRGSKGQTSRAGRHTYLGFEGGTSPLIRRIPKRGFVSKFRKEFQIVNLQDLKRIKEQAINPEVLEQNGLIKDKNKLIKILGEGDIKGAISVQAHAFSKSAQEKIKNSGGSFEVLTLVPLSKNLGAGHKKGAG